MQTECVSNGMTLFCNIFYILKKVKIGVNDVAN